MPDPPSLELLALAVGLAAKIAVRFGLTQTQAARLMSSAWAIVQDKEDSGNDVTPGCDPRTVKANAV